MADCTKAIIERNQTGTDQIQLLGIEILLEIKEAKAYQKPSSQQEEDLSTGKISINYKQQQQHTHTLFLPKYKNSLLQKKKIIETENQVNSPRITWKLIELREIKQYMLLYKEAGWQ